MRLGVVNITIWKNLNLDYLLYHINTPLKYKVRKIDGKPHFSTLIVKIQTGILATDSKANQSMIHFSSISSK
jgi:hypothetical protein